MKHKGLWCLFLFYSVANAAVHTISHSGNPNADYHDLQTAIDAAIAAGGTEEVRIQTGNAFNINVSISISNGTHLTVSGGWDSDFNTQSTSYTDTNLHAGGNFNVYGTDRVMNVNVFDGQLTLHNMAIQRGSGVGFGAGINAVVNNTSVFTMDSLLVSYNYATSSNSATGGGLSVTGFSNGQVHIIDSVFNNNTAESTSSTVSGAGFQARMNNDSQLVVSDTIIVRNISHSPSQVTGLALFIDANQDASVTFTHNYIGQNQNNEAGNVLGVNGAMWFSESAVGIIANNDFLNALNTDVNITTSALDQFNLLGANDSNIWFANNFIHDSETRGMRAEARDTSTVTLINNTFYDHGGPSMYFTGAGTGRFGNNIMALDGGASFFHANIDQINNSTDNPLLVNSDEPMIPEHSPARDTGHNNPWPDALPDFDFYDQARIGNTGIVDIGAAEVQVATELPIFANGFEIIEDD